jgi:hypothetical protein
MAEKDYYRKQPWSRVEGNQFLLRGHSSDGSIDA